MLTVWCGLLLLAWCIKVNNVRTKKKHKDDSLNVDQV